MVVFCFGVTSSQVVMHLTHNSYDVFLSAMVLHYLQQGGNVGNVIEKNSESGPRKRSALCIKGANNDD